jgi:hypothetical protein
MDISIFTDKSQAPSIEEIKKLGDEYYDLWSEITDYVLEMYPSAVAEWNYPGAKYGWSFRIKDKKRAIIYLLPRAGFFKVAFVFGQKAYDAIMNSEIDESIKSELSQAVSYAEGRGIRIKAEENIINDIKTLVKIKLYNQA